MIDIFSSHKKSQPNNYNNNNNININNTINNDVDDKNTKLPSNSIFITQNEVKKKNDVTGKLTYTDIYNTIPYTKTTTPLDEDDWRKNKQAEWRWRFMKIGPKRVVEISYIKYNSQVREYQSKYGTWVHREIPKEYDKYVIESYYYYSDM